MIRVNLHLTGSVGEFIKKIKQHKRGIVVNAILADSINSEKAKAVLSSFFSSGEIEALYSQNTEKEVQKFECSPKIPTEEKKEVQNVATNTSNKTDSDDSKSYRVQI